MRGSTVSASRSAPVDTLRRPRLLGRLQWVHRVLAFLFAGHSIGMAFTSRRLTGEGSAAYRRAAWTLAGLAVLQISVGAAMILSLLPISLRAAHLFVGALVWTAAIVVAFRSRRVVGGPLGTAK